MNNTIAKNAAILALGLGVFAAGCFVEEGDVKPAGEPKRVAVGKNVALEVHGEQRRVLVNAFVCLREGLLEQFLTRKHTKEHEAVLAADVDARHIHTALVLAKASPGSPVRFNPEYRPARGDRIKISLEFKDDKGMLKRVPAQQWIRNIKTKKDMEHDWVFAGSILIGHDDDKSRPPIYAANDGDIICLSNFETAMLDLPISSTKENIDLNFEAHTERIPALKTPVTVILEPVVTNPKR